MYLKNATPESVGISSAKISEMINNLNNSLQSIINMANSGKSPSQVMNMLIQQNPNVKQSLTQLQNMAQGRDMKEFVLQLMKQNTGIDPQMFQSLSNIMGVKK